MEIVLDIVHNDGMTSIVTSLRLEVRKRRRKATKMGKTYLATSTDIGLAAKNIRKFAFSLVTPLGAENDGKAFVGEKRRHGLYGSGGFV